MVPAADLLTTADYIRVLRPHLPRAAFAAHPGDLVRVAFHLAIVAAALVGLRFTDIVWLWPVYTLVIGHEIACLAFHAHDLTHGALVRSRPVRRGLELLLWGLNVTPPTMWRRLHNETHHHEANTVHDTDRLFRASEETRLRRVYALLLYPHSETLAGAPLVMIHFLTYIARHLVSAFLSGEQRLPIATAKPRYARGDRARITLELAVILALQVGIYFAVSGGWRYVWAAPIALLITSAVVMTYIWTNHLLNPLCEHTDPLVSSTTVIVPGWMNWLHANFAYHTEHHVFPTMNPRYYPLVSRLLQEHFPDRYNRITLGEAWRRIWRHGKYIDEPAPQTQQPSPADAEATLPASRVTR
jgi:fatty acid desaturase